jgi:esterase/lipase
MLITLLVTILFGIGLVIIFTRMVPPLKKITNLPRIPDTVAEIFTSLERSENAIGPKPGTEKQIILPLNFTQNADFSMVYFHGFSASRREASPLFEKVASHFSAALYLTRFQGHGLGPDELGSAKGVAWIADAVEAYQIGLKLGNEVVITCMSTGCALGLYLAYFFPDKIKALILLSPNFGPADPKSFLALGPLGPLITRAVVGKYHAFKPANSQQAYYWTFQYGSAVIPEMITLVTAVKNLNLSEIKIPVLTLYTPFDSVVSATEIEKHVPLLGSPKNKLIALVETQEHVLAGDIMNPLMTDKIAKECIDFLKGLDKE